MKNKTMIILLLLTLITIGISSETASNKDYVAGGNDLPIYIGRSIRV